MNVLGIPSLIVRTVCGRKATLNKLFTHPPDHHTPGVCAFKKRSHTHVKDLVDVGCGSNQITQHAVKVSVLQMLKLDAIAGHTEEEELVSRFGLAVRR